MKHASILCLLIAALGTQTASQQTSYVCNYARVYKLKSGSHLIIRSRPSPASSKVGLLENGNPVYICDERGEWLKVFYGGGTSCGSVSSNGIDERHTVGCKSGWVNRKWIDVVSG